MILAIDIGNTNIVVGCCKDNKVSFVERISTNHTATELEYAVSIKTILELYNIDFSEIDGAIISSVVPTVTITMKRAIKKITGCEAMIIGPGIKTGLSIVIDNPAQLGSDLVVDAVAGIHEYGAPIIIFDLGTATTISVVDKNNNYIKTACKLWPSICKTWESHNRILSEAGNQKADNSNQRTFKKVVLGKHNNYRKSENSYEDLFWRTHHHCNLSK